MRFLFVHAWRGFSLAEWSLRRALGDADVEVQAVDLAAAEDPASDLLARVVAAWKPDLVGMSCHAWSLPALVEAAGWVRHLHPNARVVLGGPHVDAPEAAEDLLSRHEAVDWIVRGAGEEPLRALVDAVAGRARLADVPSLSRRVDGQIVHHRASLLGASRKRPVFDSTDAALVAVLDQITEASIETMRGCRARCTYCLYPEPRVEVFDDAQVERELSLLCSLKIPHVRVCDAHFGGSAARAKRLLRHIAKANRATSFKVYPDLKHVDPEYVDLLRAARAEVTSIGIQTTNRASLRRIRRHAVHDDRRAIELLLEAFPETPADLIVGLPGDDPEGLERTLRDVLDLGFRAIQSFRLAVFPGTEIAGALGDHLDGLPVVRTSRGQILSSPRFPADSALRVATLVHAAEIGAALHRTRGLLRGRGALESNSLDLAEALDAAELLEVRGLLANRHPGPLLGAFARARRRLAAALGGGADLEEAVGLDLVDSLRRTCQRTGRRNFRWGQGHEVVVVERVVLRLGARHWLWELGAGELSELGEQAPALAPRTLLVDGNDQSATAGRAA